MGLIAWWNNLGTPAARARLEGAEPLALGLELIVLGAFVASLGAGLNAVLRQPDVAARLKQLNVESRANTPEEFSAFVASEIDKWGKVVREANIKLG